MANPFAGAPMIPQDNPELPVIMRRQRMAEQLLQQAQEPLQGQMVSGHYVAPSWTQMLAKGVQTYMGQKGLKESDERMAELARQLRGQEQADIQKFSQLAQGTPARTIQPLTPTDDEGNPMPAAEVAGQAPNLGAAYAALLSSQSPALRQMGMQGTLQMPEILARKEERDLARKQRMEEIQMRLADARTAAAERAQLQRELAQMQIEARKEMAAFAAANRPASAPTIATIADPNDPSKSILIDAKTNRVIGNAPGDKNAKLPATALKMQQEELDNIATSSSIKSDIGALKQQLEKGELQLGPVQNILSQGKNLAGMSDQTSRNFASFRATLEKLRNDSLRLNKGVQTEGDAIRAWNELISSINDPKVVKQRLDEIERINDRAVNFRRMNIDTIRQNFGVAPMEIGGYEKPPAAVGRTVSPQDQQALDWANKNPNDPRAAQIKQRLGAQ